MDIPEYTAISLKILGWCLPHRRPRIEEILIGVEKVYSKGELLSFSHQQEVDPISASLPKSEISFEVDNSDNSYNPNNPNGLSKYLMEREKLSGEEFKTIMETGVLPEITKEEPVVEETATTDIEKKERISEFFKEYYS